ncbi:50S ribosomal protein L31e [Candidatus Woesearchaeota archaeon]|nr:MAG: 50S ribosomal protein L31e [Candidatus Woesearchaeota archaeon]
MERKYIIPLRKAWLKVPIYYRSRKAVKATREFLRRHMKVEDVKIGKYLNKKLWARGNRNPPHKVEVLATKVEDEGKVYVKAELPDAPKEEKKEVKDKTLIQKVKSKITEPKQEEKVKEEVLKEEKPKKQEKPKKVTKAKENKETSQDIRATLNKSDKKR